MKTTELSLTAAESRALGMVRALSNPARFHLVEILAERKEATVSQLAETLPLAPSSIYEHLTALREAGVVEVSGEGPNRHYCVDPAAFDYLGAYLAGIGGRARSWRALVETTRTEAGLEVRPATEEDAAAIARIYNQGIEDRVATLETELRTPEERAEWLGARAPRHPVLVAVSGQSPVGWASLNPFNPRRAYDHVVDLSIYVAREHRGRGIGDALLGELEAAAGRLGYHKMVLAAFPTNAPGMRLYQRHGFLTVGVYREQGLLDGRWVDVVVMERILA
ncbi:MAG TPA: arsinothricin resistance N-acetyltransferase ArsN1 family A [Candidatus Dormibacteraeota bacterium]|jgi:phosphinothricin acetyltransferase|nr:arsinothricin resistance N-acetyltransferase ArsN1 family A [Candidatus Dormibacteraeota bacterium]